MRGCVEVGAKRVSACALDWPGWARSGRDEQAAVSALLGYAPRYAPVAAAAGLALPDEPEFEVVERLAGNATTDFGAPAAVAKADREPAGAAEAARIAGLVEAAWAALDRVAAGAPAALRKGPRGGGRDRDAVVQHVLGAEAAYGRKVGVRHREPTLGDAAAVAALRAAILDVLRRPSTGDPVGEKGWPVRYAARRIAWHVLDHAWEIEDRSG